MVTLKYVVLACVFLLGAGLSGVARAQGQGPSHATPASQAGGVPYCSASLTACTANLNTCTDSLDLCSGNVNACSGNLNRCTGNLGTCTSGLNACGTSLTS